MKKIIILSIFLSLLFLFHNPILEWGRFLYDFIIDKNRVKLFIISLGWFAPFVFIIMQILQVVLAPIPGELTGFIGGYVFGVVLGFLYSSLSLALGSWILFIIGKFFEKKCVKHVFPLVTVDKINHLVNNRGFVPLFLCFLFPGFPKDYLCLFLGVVKMPTTKFLFLTTIGRMPGTLFLSLQGAAVFNENYRIFFVCLVFTFLVILISLKYKSYIYNFSDD